MFITAPFTIAKTWKQSKCSWTEEWIKMWYIYTMECYSATKKNEIMPFATTWMDLEIVILSEMSDREREISYDITYMWNIKRNDINELIYKTEYSLMGLETGTNDYRGRKGQLGSLRLTCTHCSI